MGFLVFFNLSLGKYSNFRNTQGGELFWGGGGWKRFLEMNPPPPGNFRLNFHPEIILPKHNPFSRLLMLKSRFDGKGAILLFFPVFPRFFLSFFVFLFLCVFHPLFIPLFLPLFASFFLSSFISSFLPFRLSPFCLFSFFPFFLLRFISYIINSLVSVSVSRPIPQKESEIAQRNGTNAGFLGEKIFSNAGGEKTSFLRKRSP